MDSPSQYLPGLPRLRRIASKAALSSPITFLPQNLESTSSIASSSIDSDSIRSAERSRKGKERAENQDLIGGEDESDCLVVKEVEIGDSSSSHSIELENESQLELNGAAASEQVVDLLRKQLRSTSLGYRTNSEEIQPQSASRTVWKRRRYYILSRAGKLIYTSEDTEDASVYAGIISAVVGIFTDESDTLVSISAPPSEIHFLVKSPIYLVVISDWGEPKFVLRAQLEYLYLNILTILTKSQLTNIFKKRENFDLRRLLEGTDLNFKTLVDTFQTSIPILTNSLEIHRLPAATRNEIAKILVPPSKIPQHLYTIILSPKLHLISILRPKSHSIHPSDLSLLLSFLKSNQTSMMESEGSWVPFCLPGFRSDGFLWVYVEYRELPLAALVGKEEYSKMAVVIVSADKENFELSKKEGTRIWTAFEARSIFDVIGANTRGYGVEELNLVGLRHFFFKSKSLGQVLRSKWEGDYEEIESRYRLIGLYQKVFEIIHFKATSADGANNKLTYIRTAEESVLGWSTPKFELYLATSPYLQKNQLITITKSITKWVAQRDKGELFLIDAPVF